jgi:hypothetical protein
VPKVVWSARPSYAQKTVTLDPPTRYGWVKIAVLFLAPQLHQYIRDSEEELGTQIFTPQTPVKILNETILDRLARLNKSR